MTQTLIEQNPIKMQRMCRRENVRKSIFFFLRQNKNDEENV